MSSQGSGVAQTTAQPNPQQPGDDQVAATRAYAKAHNLNDLFAHFLQLLLYYRPENPREFLVQEVRKIREQKVSSSLFNERDLETMFDLIDVTRQRKITITQLRNACRNLSTTSSSAQTPAQIPSLGTGAMGAGFSDEDVALEEAIAQAADEKGQVSLENFKKVVAMLLVTKNKWSS